MRTLHPCGVTPLRPRACRAALAIGGVVLLAALLPSGLGPNGEPPSLRHAPTTVASASPYRAAAVDPLAPSLSPMPLAGEGRLIVNSTDPAIVPNDGLRSNITAFPFSRLGSDASFQVSASEGIGAYTAVFGFFENPTRLLTPFFTVFNRTNVAVDLVYWNGYILQNGSGYDFALQRASGTVWQLSVNGETFGDNATSAAFDFGATEATNASTVQFTEIAIYSTTSPVPSEIWVPLAFGVRAAGGWHLPQEGRTYLSLSGVAGWGVQGRLQRAILAPGEVESGRTIAVAAAGEELWSGGPVAVDVALSAPSSAVVGTTSSAVQVQVSTPAGTAVPNVGLALQDPLGGTFQPAALITNGTGGASAGWIAPNVSATGTDRLRAVVTILGYTGSASAAVSVVPATQVVLELQGAPAQLAPGAATTLTVVARSTSGAALPGIGLSLSVSGPAYIGQSSGVTDANGEARFVITTDPVAGSAVVRATVTSPGAWGKMAWNLTLGRPAPPPWWAEPYVPLLLIAGPGTAVGLFLWQRRRRRPGAELPPLALARQPRRPGPPPPIRTPP